MTGPVPEERFVEACNQTGFLELPISDGHIFAVKSLSRPADAPRHNDPFDRLLIAQAKVEGMHLLTHDELLGGLRRILRYAVLAESSQTSTVRLPLPELAV